MWCRQLHDGSVAVVLSSRRTDQPIHIEAYFHEVPLKHEISDMETLIVLRLYYFSRVWQIIVTITFCSKQETSLVIYTFRTGCFSFSGSESVLTYSASIHSIV